MAVTPIDAPIAIAASRSAIDQSRHAARTSYRFRISSAALAMPSGACTIGISDATSSGPSMPCSPQIQGESRAAIDDGERADHAADQLHPQAEPEQPLEAAPVAARGVPVPVLDDDLVDRQVEEELQEPGDREDEGEAGEVSIRQLACRDNRGENAEEDGTVDPDGGRDTPPEDTEAHLRRPV